MYDLLYTEVVSGNRGLTLPSCDDTRFQVKKFYRIGGTLRVPTPVARSRDT